MILDKKDYIKLGILLLLILLIIIILLFFNKKEENLITTEYEDKFVSKNMPIYSLKAIKEDV